MLLAPAFWLLCALGAAAGILAGFVPGLHPNTLLAVVPLWPDAAVALVAMAVAHNFSSQWSGTYVGIPGDDSLGCLPMHRMVLTGKGPIALRAALDGTLAGLTVAVLLVLPVKWILAEPLRLGTPPAGLLPWLAAAVLVFLLVQDARRGLRTAARALLVQVLAGSLGIAALRLPLGNGSALAVLGGLFGAATLVEALLAGGRIPAQEFGGRTTLLARRRMRRAAWLGSLGAIWTVTMPGVTAATAAAATPLGARSSDVRPVITLMAAVGAAHQVLALAALWVLGRAGTGLAMAVRSTSDVAPWVAGRPPAGLAALLAAALAAGIAGYFATRAAEAPLTRFVQHLPPRLLPGATLAALVAVTAWQAGSIGLLVLAAGAAIGCVPISCGIRRVHLTAALLAPVAFGLR